MPQSSVQTIPDILDGVEIRTVSGTFINEINVALKASDVRTSCM